MDLTIQQTSTQIQPNRWRWSVWLEGSQSDLERVEYVTYILHPTFSNPVRHVTDRQSKFRLDSSGWGEFNINIKIMTGDGKIIEKRHWLTLQYPERGENQWRRKNPKLFMSYGIADARLAEQLTKALAANGIETVSDVELRFGESIERTLLRGLQDVNGALFIVTDARSPWLKNESDVISMLGAALYVVSFSLDIELPDPLCDATFIIIKPDAGLNAERGIRSIATRIAKRIAQDVKEH